MSHFLHIAYGALTASAVCLSAAPPRHQAELTLLSESGPEADEQSVAGGGFELRPESMGLNAGADAPILTGGRFTLIGGMAATDRTDQDQPDPIEIVDDDDESLWPGEESMEDPAADDAPNP